MGLLHIAKLPGRSDELSCNLASSAAARRAQLQLGELSWSWAISAELSCSWGSSVAAERAPAERASRMAMAKSMEFLAIRGHALNSDGAGCAVLGIRNS